MNFPFPLQTELTQIALSYTNEAFIADQVLAKTPVGSRSFKYLNHNKAERFTIPETIVGRKGRPTEVEFTATESTAAVLDYGLDDVIPVEDVESAPPGINPIGKAVEGIAELVMLDREKRVSDLVFAAATYPAGNKATLSGTSQWSDYTNSDPLSAMLAAMDGMLIRPNTLVLSQSVWSKLRQHPKMIAALYPSGGNASVGGIFAGQQNLAQLLEVDSVIIGRGWYNSAKPGQTPTMTRLWGKHAAMLYLNPQAGPTNGITFGFTATWGTRVAGQMPEPKVGLRGGTRVRTGETLKELVVASDVGYFFENAIA
jgi:hypothetical protein